MTTYYDILQIDEKASLLEIKKAYRSLAKKYHPDINPDPDAAQLFMSIEVAYSCLSKTDSRLAYDRLLLFKRTNYSNPKVEQKFYNDVNRRKRAGQDKAERRSQMSYQQYRREEMLTESLWALILNSIITVLVGFFLLRIIYILATDWYGTDSNKWSAHIGMYVMSFLFLGSVMGISYIYEPMVKRLFVGKPKNSREIIVRSAR